MPIHILSAISPPSTTLKQIQSILPDFFWGWREDKKKYHWSSWKNLSLPYDEGGIGVRQMSDICQAFQFKHWWIFRTKQTLWGDFLRAKYCQRSNPISKKWDTGESQAWKLLMRNKHRVEKHIQWKIRNGSSSFWWDNWLGIGSLAQFTTTSHRFDNETIADFTTNGQWNVDKLNQIAPQIHLHKILSTHLQLQHTSTDQAVWNLNANGLFTISSAWDIIREKRTKTKFNSYTWNRNIPFKCSFLLWRTIRGKIPTNEKLASFGIEPSECYCCHSPGADTIDHIFNSGNLAKNVWKFFAIPLGIPTDFLPLRSMIMSLCKLLENCIHDSKVTPVQWIKPPENWVKLNTDGSALNNPGSIGAGGVLRNHMGELLLAFSIPLGEGTNDQAEVEAALFGLTWCAQLNYNKVILEVDSQLLVDCFLNKKIIPWSISSQMQRLQQLSSNFPQIKCIHTLREANFVADTLSKHSHQLTSQMIYFNTQQLPKTAATYLQQDMAGMASFRRRKLKRIKEPP
ncbi:hypothetical protein MTR67_039014 [Solanum verrucosum]|uniref:RNase H type-1 domain-containing protein n=1 Tax=Solanum verrucosum TaxID=315347 RepID=A0AAF0UHW1_SOLVR|nr:hypothetical protein MTR67_039014 [Solanum verrucosum]